MNKTQTARWNAANDLFRKLIEVSQRTNAVIEYDGMKINADQIIFNDTTITVVHDGCYYPQFDCDPMWDEGLYISKADYKKYVRDNFKLVKYVRW